ncbi:unnamed protein product [Lupinus luteus]|uniref:Disease resistance protein At4g27190-like leucine-rich repeats domain-containing protein n=1 Tax=Lupinus luteus TaxID=3873 RepID=A0AAV1X5M9_LUPLU
MIKDISSLLEVEITRCKIMSKSIVDDDAKFDKIEFPQLHSLTIDYLPNLTNFYSKPTPLYMEFRSETEYEDSSSLFDNKVIQSVEQLSLSNKDILFICNDQQSDVDFYQVKALSMQRLSRNVEFPTNFLQRFTNLEELALHDCSFESIPHIEHAAISNKLKTLKLNSLRYLENKCQNNSQIEQILQNLQTLKVFRSWSLLTIAPSHV